MLLELSVRDLGVIDEVAIVLGDGMTALTGETGAGKTLVVQAIDLLTGGRADPVLVRPGAEEACVEGRFLDAAGDEVLLRRVVPASGRSRAYIDGHMATATALADVGRDLVDLHGQHAHQSLLAAAVQRSALDRYGAVDLAPLREARRHAAELADRLRSLGGDERARRHEIDLLRFQLAEIAAVHLDDLDEEARLEELEDGLAEAVSYREAAAEAHAVLADDDGVADQVGHVVARLAGRRPFAAVEGRLRSVAADLDDIAAELRSAEDRIVDDPERLAEVRARRQLIRDLCRKYGDDIGAVIAFADEAATRLGELERHDVLAAELEEAMVAADQAVVEAAEVVAATRRRAAPRLAADVVALLPELALPRARLDVAVDGADPADEVTFTFDADGDGAALPLSKVASGGELARVMLALRLVLTAGPPTLVFDEVDAGIGGQAAVAVGRSLGALAADHQVLVVTHLAQVAAHADHHLVVAKADGPGGRVRSTVEAVDSEARVVELSRMLGGRPDSASGREHAAELLSTAAAGRRDAS
jgi:DNA repair protein RecN (Recombination protein N)